MKRTLLLSALLALSACASRGTSAPPSTTPPAPVTCEVPTAAQQCDDIWFQELGRHIDPDGLTGCLAQFKACASGGEIRKTVQASPEFKEHQDALDAAERAPQFAPITNDGKVFRAGDQSWRWRGFSAFKLAARFQRGEDIDGVLEDAKGYNVLRVWDYTPVDKVRGDGKDWEGEEWESTPPHVWIDFLAAVGRKGFRVELTLLTDDDPARIEPAKRLIEELVNARVTNVIFEAANEPRTNGKKTDTSALRSVLEWAGSKGYRYSSGDYEEADRFYGNFFVVHTGRDHEWPRRAHDVLDGYEGIGPSDPEGTIARGWHVPSVCDEPGKWQDVGTEPSDWRGYFGACSLLGAGATFHSESGKLAKRLTDLERSLASIALSAMNAFPDDAPKGPYGRPGDDSLRTYTVGDYAVRVRPRTPAGPFRGKTLDPDGVLWKLGGAPATLLMPYLPVLRRSLR
jgi:hypothetical protein